MKVEDVTPDRLLTELRDPGQRVEVTDPSPAVRAAWRRAIDAVRRDHLAPDGTKLRHTGRDRGNLVVWLEPASAAPPARPDPVPVPEEVTEVHRVLGSAEDLAGRLDVESASAPRALRLLHALIEAAEARGYSVSWASTSSTLALERDGYVETISCTEEREHREVVPTTEELGDDAPRYSWQRVQTERRLVATGRLSLRIGDDRGRHGRRSRWADRERWRLEGKLGEVLAEVERRTDDAVRQQQARNEQARQRQVQWREAMEAARTAFEEQRRRDELTRQVEAWQRAEHIRAYARALTAAADAGDHPCGRAEVAAWADWAHSHADSIDPTVAGDLSPGYAEPTAEQLRPHLSGWSPYGPERR